MLFRTIDPRLLLQNQVIQMRQ